MINSINTNIAAYFAQTNIGIASSMASASVSRLSSGNRIVKASDDVAALSTGTSLRTQVTTLRQALTNASQGTSLLQVADGALSQITEILQRQKAIALQAGSGSLTDTDRAYLNQEFQALTSEINRLTGSVNFNGVKLLDGTLSETVNVNNNSTNAAQGTITINFSTAGADAVADGDTLILNGVTITLESGTVDAAGEVALGGSLEETLDNIVSFLNSAQTNVGSNALTSAEKLLVSKASYKRVGNQLVITGRAGGALSEFYRVSESDILSGTKGAEVTGRGRESTLTSSDINVATIDADATVTGIFGTSGGVLQIDSTTIYTIADGDSLRAIVNGINANTATTGYSAFITGNSGAYNIVLRTANLNATGSEGGTGLGSVTFGNPVDQAIQSFANVGVSGIGANSVLGVGNTGGEFSLLTDQTQQRARSVISFPEIAAGDLLSTSNFGTARTITIEGQTFTFTTTNKSNKAQTEITIGDSLTETLDNAVEAINNFSGLASVNYAFRQIQARREGNSIVIESKQPGNALDISGGTITIAASLMTGGAVSSNDLSNTSNTGIDTKGVMNANFVGTLKGFNASYVSANLIDLSITVGGIKYEAKNVTSNPTSNTTVRLISETGGYFDVTLRANQGVEASSSADAETFAKKLDAAFSGITFYQSRGVSSYTPSGSLLGSSVSFTTDDFDGVKIDNITVSAPSGSNVNGNISFTINGELYTALVGLGSQLGAYSVTRFVSASDPSKYLEFHNGGSALNFSTDDEASALKNVLRDAFGVGTGSSALSFQIGATSSDTLSVAIGSATTASLYEGATLDVLSQLNASAASSALDKAIATVTTIRANVGALQSRFNFASANIQISVQNQDAARGELLDTDIASESTNYATAQVKLQAGISVLAQANQQLQSLLKLIG